MIAIEEIKVRYTLSAITETIKKDLAMVQIDVNEYRDQIRERKKYRKPSEYFFDFEDEIDYSIDPDDYEDVRSKLYDDKLYYYKAYHYIKRLGLFQKQEVPLFKVKLSHLSPGIIYELKQLDEKDRKFVLKQAVAKIFEDIYFALYHDSASCNLGVILVK
jgi:hypothetical protein